MPENNVVYIGHKPTMSYVMGVLTQANDGQEEIFIKARGKAISKAVDVAEVVTKKQLRNYRIEKIESGTEERDFEDERTGEKSKINVSTISIRLVKG